ncbi:hypothetical protein C8A01DRAFT_18450 [Parachaetomium inaequale]|uniref:Uncharacterized protein n=1 Tax=Parachaetomium inaequale TaxID=2588326 RepID=A0AAN6PF05_9PEZI|nr:hypothetical protein C8A01DRAFT_18450 [Parachaetomium inaequale]
MLSERQRRQSLSFAENVALLSLLRRAPTARHANPRPHSVAQEDSGRLLSFEREVSLTNTLAFLCGISDNPLHVVATCVEELVSRKGIRVLVAINKKHSTSGSGTLMRIKCGLEEVFRYLSRVDHVEDALLEGLVLRAIASLCKDRIFSRIKSRRRDAAYTKRGRVFLGTVLQQTLNAVRKHSGHTGSKSEVETFARNSRNLLDCLARLEICQEMDVLTHLKDVLCATHRLSKTTNLDSLFKGLGPTELDPLLQRSFIARLRKLAQYRECALYMIRIAKSLGLFKETEVKLISLEAQLFATDLTTSPDCRLTGCLSRCGRDASSAFGVQSIASKLQELDRDNSTFLSTVGGILGDARVHAEVQIVCYYELYPVARKPRVICSSKDACYLCNLFIQLHGTFHVPRTHGNLYTSWRLPPLPSLNHVQAQLNKALEAQIREAIGGLMSTETPRLTLFQNENESTVFPFSTSLPTPASSAGDAPIPKPKLKPVPQLEPAPEPELEPGPSPLQPPNPTPSPEPAPAPPPEPNSLSNSLPSPIPSHLPPHLLARGHPITLRLDTTKPLPSFTTGLITLYPDFIRSLSRTPTPTPTPSRTPQPARTPTPPHPVEEVFHVHIQIHWLPRRRAAALYVARPRGFVDLELDLFEEEGVDVDSGSAECVYVAYRGEVVVVDVLRGGVCKVG